METIFKIIKSLLVAALFCIVSSIVQASDLFMTDLTDRVLRYDGTTGEFIDAFVDSGPSYFPTGLTFGPDGNLYVTDPGLDSIVRFDGKTGAFIDVFASGGKLSFPLYLVFGPDGNLYVDSRDEVLRYDGTTGDFIDVFASGGGLDGLTGLIFGPDGNLYVSSSGTDNVLRYDGTTGDFIDVFASGGGLDGPRGLVFGPDGNLYLISRGTGNVLRYDGTTGDFIDVFASLWLETAVDQVFGPDGNLYVASLAPLPFVLRYDGTTGDFIEVFASGGGINSPTFLTFGPKATCSLDLVLSYTDNTLSMNFDIGSQEPSLWGVWLHLLNKTRPLWRIPIPVVDPPASFTIPFTGFPSLGNIGVLTTLTRENGIICSDWETVDTGPFEIGTSAPTEKELKGLFRKKIKEIMPNLTKK